MPLGGASAQSGLDYADKGASLLAVFTDANTTSAAVYLSEDLSTTVQTIVLDDVEALGIRWTDIPGLFIRAKDSELELAAMGDAVASSRGRHYRTVNWEIFGLYKREGRSQNSSGLLGLVYDFARNVETVLSNNTTLGNSALWARARRTDFGDVIVNGDAVKGFRVDVEARYFVR
jgi:hypothetical protein